VRNSRQEREREGERECSQSPGELNPGAEKRDYNTKTKTVQIGATSAEHAVFLTVLQTEEDKRVAIKFHKSDLVHSLQQNFRTNVGVPGARAPPVGKLAVEFGGGPESLVLI
jgi:hypothetical protein